MVNRKNLLISIFNKNNVIKVIDFILPLDLPEEEPVKDIPELSGELLYYEAMRLGVDPSTIAPGKLKEMVMSEIIKSQKKQNPPESGTENSGNSVDG